jgi:MFS family permease
MFDDHKKRWWALYVLCCGVLMIVLDTTIVNVALPSIREDLQFSETSLVWVVNAYMLTFGGFLLLGGRLGDLFGSRKLYLLGLVFFTAASVGCGLANTQTLLIVARALQGLGGAVVTAVALSLIMNLFTDGAERAKAMGIYGFVCSAGGSIGVLLGGLLTTTLNWAVGVPDQRQAATGGSAPRRQGAAGFRGRLHGHELDDARGIRHRERTDPGLDLHHHAGTAGHRGRPAHRFPGDRITSA